MPGSYRAPGVYVEELPSSVHPVVGVSTSTAAFVDVFLRGPVGLPVKVSGPGDFERTFGGIWSQSESSYGIAQFFVNGGGQAWVVRVASDAAAASKNDNAANLTVQANNPGKWGNSLYYAIQAPLSGAAVTTTFDLVVGQVVAVPGAAKQKVVVLEVFRSLTITPGDPRNCLTVVNGGSQVVQLSLTDSKKALTAPASAPSPPAKDVAKSSNLADFTALTDGADGNAGASTDQASDAKTIGALLKGDPDKATGIWALDTIAPDIFNILCLPAMATITDGAALTDLLASAESFCEGHRAMLLVDPPASQDPDQPTTPASKLITAMASGTYDPSANAALYFPRLVIADPGGGTRNVGPSGTVAGIYARTDNERGVWKAPAGTEATLRGARPTVAMPDAASDTLNPLGINVLRTFPVYNNVVWGARTLQGADLVASQWKYVPVRRTALFIEESLRQGLQWVVFEPNAEPLWAQIRLNVGAFMQNLFRLGAFAGTTPNEAYLVKCDSDTTTPYDVSTGVVNIRVGFQPLQPCEFVVIQIQQLTQPAEG